MDGEVATQERHYATVSPAFKLTFLGVLGVTVLSMLLSCSMIFAGVQFEPGSEGAGTLQALVSIFKLGFGALVGMVGGKTM